MKIDVSNLATVDEVIGKVVENKDVCYMNEEFVVLEPARSLVMKQSECGQIGLGMMPFMPSADNPSTDGESDIKIYTKFIVAEPVSIPKDLEDAYIRTTSTIAIV